MIIPMTSDMKKCIELATELRNNNINTEIYYNQKNKYCDDSIIQNFVYNFHSMFVKKKSIYLLFSHPQK